MVYHLELQSADVFATQYARTGAYPSEVISQEGGSLIQRTILPGGVRVITEFMPGQYSASLGAWIPVGSRDEDHGSYGSTHFLEHLLFKGTKNRSAFDIATAFDEVGGESNAATAKESTCYFARVVDSDVPMALEVILDMVTSATLSQEELEQERNVILEELAMDSDDPTDVAHEKFVEAVFASRPALARPIGGTAESVENLAHSSMISHYDQHYLPKNLVVTAAGGVDHDRFVGLVEKGLLKGGWTLDPTAAPHPRRVDTIDTKKVIAKQGKFFEYKDIEQAHVIIGGTSIPVNDDRRYAMSLMNAVLGGGMSSRLFQEIREIRGLAYTTYSFNISYSDAGYFGMYAGTMPDQVEEVTDLMKAELEKIAQGDLTEAELHKARGQLKGGSVLALEDTGSRLSRLARAEVTTGNFMSLAENLKAMENVQHSDISQLASELVDSVGTQMIVGQNEPNN